jgi:hypothetical protein
MNVRRPSFNGRRDNNFLCLRNTRWVKIVNPSQTVMQIAFQAMAS